MQKYLLSELILILSLLLLPITVLAADDFVTNANMDISLDDVGITLTILSNATADEMVVSGSSVQFTLSANSTVILRSAEKRLLNNTLSVSTDCQPTFSTLTLPAQTAATTVTVTPSRTDYCGGGSSSGGSGSTDTTVSTPASTSTAETPVTTTEAPATTTETPAATTTTYKDGDLIRAEGDTKVYVLKDGKKEHITSPEAFAAAGYDWANVQVVAASVVEGYADYVVIAPAGGTLYRIGANPEVYYVENNLWRHIPTVAVFNAYNFSWSDIAILPAGGLDAFTPANLYRLIGGTKVYKIANSKKTWIETAEEFNAAGYDWNKIVSVNAEELAYYPETGGTVLGESVGTTIIIKATRLNVRSLPSLKGIILDRVVEGEVYKLLAEEDGWYKITTKIGVTGWCYGGDTGGYASKQ